MSNRDAALATIVEIASNNNICAEDIERALAGMTDEKLPASSVLRQLLAYIGGVFVFAGISVYIGMFWEEMNSAARIIITLGSGAVSLVLAILLLGHDRFARAATPLFLMAGLLQATGILVAFDELGSGGDPQLALLATTLVMLAQQLLIFARYQRSVLLFIALIFGLLSCGNSFDLLGMDEDLSVMFSGLSLLLVTWGIDKTRHHSITPFWYFLGGAALLWAAFDLLEDTSVHVLFLGLTALVIYISTSVKSRSLLFVGTLAMMGYLGYYSSEYFVDSVGWPISLVVMGLMLIALSNLALRINRKYITES